MRGDNGDGRPPDGGGLPDLPPEWGTVVIPDDASALDRESAWLRRQFRREARRNRWRRRLGRPSVYHRFRPGPPALAAPIMILLVALITTLTSLIVVAWPGHPLRSPAVASPSVATSPVADTTLRDAAGHDLRLREHLPAVLLILRGCPCLALLAGTAQVAGVGVTVIVIDRVAPTLPADLPGGSRIRTATDPGGQLTPYASKPPATGAAVLLIQADGTVLAEYTGVSTLDSIRDQLLQLA